MGTMLYDTDAVAQKRALVEYFDKISASLDEIGKVSVSDSWDCTEADNLNTKLVDLQGMISSIKSGLNSYLDLFGLANSTYSGLNSDIISAISNYVKD